MASKKKAKSEDKKYRVFPNMAEALFNMEDSIKMLNAAFEEIQSEYNKFLGVITKEMNGVVLELAELHDINTENNAFIFERCNDGKYYMIVKNRESLTEEEKESAL